MEKKYLIIISSILFFLLILLNCKLDSNDKSKGSISGKASYSNNDDNSSITVYLSKNNEISSAQDLEKSENSSILSKVNCNKDGSYTIADVETGTYAIYAFSSNSVEKMVSTQITVTENNTATADDLVLTATGSVSGKITLDSSANGNEGFKVYIRGTSYSAITNSTGNFKITGIPAGSGYEIYIEKEKANLFWKKVDVKGLQNLDLGNKNITTKEIQGNQGNQDDDYCSVTFVKSESDATQIKQKITGIKKGQKLSSEQLTIESALIPRGHNFAGWICKSNKEIFTKDTAINEDIVLYPSFTAQKYRIEYVPDFIPEGYNQYELFPEYHTYGIVTQLPEEWSWHIEGQNEEIFSIGQDMITDDIALIGTYKDVKACTGTNYSEHGGYFCRDGIAEPWSVCAADNYLDVTTNTCKERCPYGPFKADGQNLYKCNDSGTEYVLIEVCEEPLYANPELGGCFPIQYY